MPEGPPLAQCPERFREIFGDCEFPVPQVRKLLAAAALTVVKDYYIQPDRQKDPKARREMARAKLEAERYIFSKRYLPAGHIFSFEVVCQTLGIDPDFARRGILARSPDEIRGLVRRLTFHKNLDDADDGTVHDLVIPPAKPDGFDDSD